MTFFLNAVAGIAAGIIGAMGIGGGGILIIYLTLYLGMSQQNSQGLNLLFFIPCAIVAIIIHTKNKLINWKKALPLILLGLVGVVIGSIISPYIGDTLLRKLFAGFLLLIGIYTLFSKEKSTHG